MGVRIYFESIDQGNGMFFTPDPIYLNTDDEWVVKVDGPWVHVLAYEGVSRVATPKRVASYPNVSFIDWVATAEETK